MSTDHIVYSPMGNSTYKFPTLMDATAFYNCFPGDARLVAPDGETILEQKQILTKDDFSALVRAGLYVLYLRRGLPDLEDPSQHPDNFTVCDEDLQVYAEALRLLRSNKGIFLSGPVGVGKTSLFEFFNLAHHSGYIAGIKPLYIISCPGIAKGYQEKGFDIFEQLHIGAGCGYEIVLDDLGADLLMGNNGYVKYYGDSLQVLNWVMYQRHAAYVATGLKTHVTSNLDLEDIASRYRDHELDVDRISGRINECTTTISMTTGSKRK